MTSESQNFIIYAGDSKTVEVDVTDNAGNPVDLTTYTTIVWKLAINAYTSAIVTKTLALGGITCPVPASGKFYVSLIGTDTSSLAGLYYHEGTIIDGVNNKTTTITGRAIIKKAIA
jgi:hypothetical protein